MIRRLRYMPSNVPSTGNERLEEWLRREFQALRLGLDGELEGKVSVGTTAMGGTQNDLMPNIGASFQNIDDYVGILTEDPAVTMDPVAGTFVANRTGLFEVSFVAALVHAEENAGRTIYVRVFDLTNGVQAGGLFAIGIGRNTPTTNISISGPVPVENPGKAFVLQIGGGDAVLAPTWVYKQLRVGLIGP